jgi:hypothetical protein
MSAHARLTTALIAALEGYPLEVTQVFDAPPVRAAAPYALVEETVLTDWSTKDMDGREGRVTISLHDVGERPARLRELAGAAEDALSAMPRTLGGGWWIASLAFVRSRIVAEGVGRWRASAEWRVRMLKNGI